MKTLEDFEKEWNNEAKNLILYHYTSIDSIKNILESETFWATHISFENDKKELEAAFEVLKTVLEERLEEENEERRKSVLHETLKRITKYLSYMDESEICKMINEKKDENERGVEEECDSCQKFMHCIISFCTKSDEKLLWSYYGNNGNGGCIAFNASELVKSFRLNGIEAHLYKCIYDEKEQKYFINALIEKTFESEILKKRPELFGQELFNRFLQYACVIKKWQNESEWRLVYKQIPTEFMDLRKKYVAYCKIQINNLKNCSQRIILGANADEKNEELRDVLKKKGINEMKIEKSKVKI